MKRDRDGYAQRGAARDDTKQQPCHTSRATGARDNEATPLTRRDTHWRDVSRHQPFRLFDRCGWSLATDDQWTDGLRGHRHSEPPWRLCRTAEDNHEHIMFPLWTESLDPQPSLGAMLDALMAAEATPTLHSQQQRHAISSRTEPTAVEGHPPTTVHEDAQIAEKTVPQSAGMPSMEEPVTVETFSGGRASAVP